MARVTLDQLAEQHDLLSACITRYRDKPGSWFSCSLQWADASKPRGRGIVQASGDTASEALNKALAKMPDERFPLADAA